MQSKFSHYAARVTRLGRKGCDVVEALGRATVFLVQSAVGVPSREGWSLWLRQMHFVGVLSLAIVLVSGLFIGMVLALQGYTILVDFGAEEALGQMVALSL
ncbi:MAG TPA: ABC transporter permease, partial [Halomonas sp.]|nr:ABC transporter permease [Halomonas sp.]